MRLVPALNERFQIITYSRVVNILRYPVSASYIEECLSRSKNYTEIQIRTLRALVVLMLNLIGQVFHIFYNSQ